MDLDLKDKNVVITGSSRGIGLSIAKAFISEGSNVVVNSRSLESLISSTKDLNCRAVEADVSNPSEAMKLIKESTSILGSIDILVCNVGNGSSVVPGEETYEEWQEMFKKNLFSSTNMVEAAREELSKTKGVIVCISSICGCDTIAGAPVTYSVAKTALNAYVKGISIPLAEKEIRINAIAPGNILFEGSVWEDKIKRDPQQVNKMIKERVSLNRFGSPEDISNLCLWLSSSLARNVTGTIFVSDGGQLSK